LRKGKQQGGINMILAQFYDLRYSRSSTKMAKTRVDKNYWEGMGYEFVREENGTYIMTRPASVLLTVTCFGNDKQRKFLQYEIKQRILSLYGKQKISVQQVRRFMTEVKSNLYTFTINEADMRCYIIPKNQQ